MVEMIFVAIAFLVPVFMFVMMILDGVNVSYYRRRFKNAIETLKTKKRARKHRNDPIYERIAKAYEWKAELYLRKGEIEQARDEFRKAEKTRREAMEAMMNGQEPKL